jgi:flagellar biosynthesis protein FlhG
MRSFTAAPGFERPRIWAVGGGKGGVGKSVVAANLSMALAERGERCALIDLDLGGANLHTLLGVARPRRTLSHFLGGAVDTLEDVLSPTSVPQVWLASGSGALLEIANLQYSQKLKLLRHVRRLPVSHVVLDLGAGSAFNVLDFFLAADAGLLVVVPEPTSVENAYHFLKAAFFRSLRHVAREPGVRRALESALAAGRRGALTPRELVREAGRLDPAAGRLLEERVRRFTPRLLVNQVDREEHQRLGPEMSSACADQLGVRVGYLGGLALDAAVVDAVRRQLPVLQLYTGCAFASGLRRAADRLLADTRADPAPVPAWRAPGAPLPLARHGLAPAPRERAPAVATARRPARVLAPLAREAADGPGSYLRRCRERLGLSLAELEQRTRLRSLERIEQERFAELPPAPYLAGHVRQYARELGIADAEALAASFLERSRVAPRSA